MTKAAADSIQGHWYKLIDDFQISPRSFYKLVEQAIADRRIPKAELSRVDWKEGGVLSARREYLRVTRAHLIFDICGAPLGRGFFFSWWLTKKPASGMGLLIVIGALVCLGLTTGLFGATVAMISLPLLLLALAYAVRRGYFGSNTEEVLLATPVLGALYDRIFRPNTYYRIDTMRMFQLAIHEVVVEQIDALTKKNGLRALTESERKPILRDIFRR